MLAAEAAFDALRAGVADERRLSAYGRGVRRSWIRKDMEPASNMHANFVHGFVGGMVRTGVQYLLGPGPQRAFAPDHVHMEKLNGQHGEPALELDGRYLLDKLTDVYHSGTTHDEKQPAHLKIIDTEICATRCLEEFGNPCTKFCPAQVYNMRPNVQSGRLEMEVDFANCVHCKTCDIRDPYQVITWVPPEGGNGPEYEFL
jgi:electron-transferring-flavoprotein dehydrogenase